MNGESLGQLLKEVEEAYEKDLKEFEDIGYIDFNDEDSAQEAVLDILKIHGSNFILDILEKEGACNLKKSHLVNARYDELSRKYPKSTKKKIREMVSTHFNISDKTVQKHIYKGRK